MGSLQVLQNSLVSSLGSGSFGPVSLAQVLRIGGAGQGETAT